MQTAEAAIAATRVCASRSGAGSIWPLEGAGGKLTSTVSSPIQVHGVTKVPAKRAPALGEHSQEILAQLGFGATEIDALYASGTVPKIV
jgi:crotonobetainyl-CoA:carnitine CoA-transferase CaiB-like acyl-CoA transferase